MNTIVRRINLPDVQNLEQEIDNLCALVGVGGHKLVTSFVYDTQLVLIFRK